MKFAVADVPDQPRATCQLRGQTADVVGDWVLGNWFTNPSGAHVSASTADYLYAQSQGGHAMITPQALTTWAAQNRYTQWWSYQPAAHWWQLQLTEGAWLLAASLLLITASILLIRRRPA